MTAQDTAGPANHAAMQHDPSLWYLLRRIALAEERVRALVAHRRAGDPAPDDPFLGLYVSDEAADRLLLKAVPDPSPDVTGRRETEDFADQLERTGARLRLRDLARAAQFDDGDLELLVLCLLPDLDSRFERLYGYLNDDVTRRRCSIGLALALAGLSPVSAPARARLAPGAPLVDLAFIQVEDADRPFLTRGLRVPDRVTAHLLGSDTPDERVAEVQAEAFGHDTQQSQQLAQAVAGGQLLIYIREGIGSAGSELAVAALRSAGLEALLIDAGRLARAAAELVVPALGREALLCGAGIVVGPLDTLTGAAGTVLIGQLAELPVATILVGTQTWDPAWSPRVPLRVQALRMTIDERSALWSNAIGGELSSGIADVAGQFAFGPAQVARAMRAAQAAAALEDPGAQSLSMARLRSGARAQNAAGLERLARRVEPGVGWADLVLPDSTQTQLHELTSRARQRDRVLLDWRMRPGGGRGHGITALFAGDSGTGKTMAAEVIAGDLGLDLYTVNLAAVVDKYIGETEKNLERIFTEAGGVSAVLLFDEADAIFGKRSEVRDAHDRYANIESAYLLQRMETFEGLALLATNLRANLDEAFTRRLDAVIDFPDPDQDSRLALWQRCLRPPVPAADDLDLDYVAASFELSGGNIRSAATTAAYLAAAAGGQVGMAEVIAAVRQEYRKLGRLLSGREFSGYASHRSAR